MPINILYKQLPAILLALLPTLSTSAGEVIVSFVSQHVELSSYLVAGLWFLYHLLPSPMKAQVTGESLPPLTPKA